jgi:AAT family amino acid transporter
MPKFSSLDFVSFYVEIPVMIIMYVVWLSLKRPPQGLHIREPASQALLAPQSSQATYIKSHGYLHDLVDVDKVDLRSDEHEEPDDDGDRELAERLQGKRRWLWSLYYWFV